MKLEEEVHLVTLCVTGENKIRSHISKIKSFIDIFSCIQFSLRTGTFKPSGANESMSLKLYVYELKFVMLLAA